MKIEIQTLKINDQGANLISKDSYHQKGQNECSISIRSMKKDFLLKPRGNYLRGFSFLP